MLDSLFRPRSVAVIGASTKDLSIGNRVIKNLVVEALYLDKLMATRDANEGLNAFIEKRQPKWEHR